LQGKNNFTVKLENPEIKQNHQLRYICMILFTSS